jgi:hypothetical protein
MGSIWLLTIIFFTVGYTFIRFYRNNKNAYSLKKLSKRLESINSNGNLLDDDLVFIQEIMDDLDVFYLKKTATLNKKFNLSFVDNNINLKSRKTKFEVLNVFNVDDFTKLILTKCTDTDFGISAGNRQGGDVTNVYDFKFKVLVNQTDSSVEVYSDLYENNIAKNLKKEFAEIILKQFYFS